MKIKIASPCSARWEDMSGDERSRFCQHCQKNVYNFKAFSEQEIGELIRQKEGRVCARLYRRRDGTVLTADCPMGIAGIRRKVKVAACSVIAGGIIFGSAIATARFSNDASRKEAMNRAEALWYEAVWTVKGWFGIHPPVTVGEVAIPLPPTPIDQTNRSNDASH